MSESKPHQYRSKEKITSELRDYSAPGMKLRYIEDILQKIEDAKITVDTSTREMLQDSAVAIWEDSSSDVRKNSQTRMEYILQASREFENSLGQSEKARVYGELLTSIAQKDSLHDSHSASGLAKKAGIYAGAFVGIAFFSVSSMTGHVVSLEPTTIISQGSLAIGLGLVVAIAFFLFSRKR